jgi:glyoxylase-like metal-dependent hydrolase (beta-lactamase superfamily II)
VHWLRLHGANVYFVRSGDSWTLIDAGFPGSGRTIAEAASGLCGAAGRPGAILITHGHPDHAGSAVGLASSWNVPVLAPAGEMPFIDGSRLYPEPLVAWLSRALPRRAMEALIRGSDLGDTVRPFDPEAGAPGLSDWVCVPTPGHTPGHTAFFRPGDRTLIAGDAVLTMAWSSRLGCGGFGWVWDLARHKPRLSGPPTVVTCDWGDAARSVVALADLDPWLLATGHGPPLAGPRAASMLRAFAARVVAVPVVNPASNVFTADRRGQARRVPWWRGRRDHPPACGGNGDCRAGSAAAQR